RVHPRGVGPARQVGPELAAALVALLGLLAHELADDRGEHRRDAARRGLQRLRILHALLEDLVDHVPPLEGGPACYRTVEGAAQAVKVAPPVGPGGIAELLGA